MMEAPGDLQFPVGSIVAGKLRILRCLGVGGMGAVYEVEHEITRHRRALKLLHAQMAEIPGVVERFLREASAAGRIGNPHIVETFDAGLLDSGEPYIVMELLQGRTLAEVLRGSGHLDVTTICDLLIQICNGVAAAHAAGIVHRDLKPENLFLTGENETFVKILDFGISKFDASITGVEGITIEGSPLGTPFYMSPEQVKGRKSVDVRTDVYALGVVLYECLTSRRPFDADNLPQLAYLISQGEFAPPSELRPSLPKVLDSIVAKAMALDPAHRFASTSEFGQAIVGLRRSLAPPPNVTPTSEVPPLSGAPPSAQSRRGSPALTPDVFSRSASQLAQYANTRGRKHKLLIGVSLVMIALVVLGTFLSPRVFRMPQATPASSSLEALPKHERPAAQATEPIARPGVPLVMSATGSATPASSGIAPVPVPSPRAPSNAASPVTRVRSVASAAAPNRAASHGLSVDNPFK